MNWKNNFFRAIALLLVLLLAVSLVVPVLAAEDADTIYIDNAGDLAELASLCALDTWSQGKTVVLRSDISLANTAFEPIPTFGGTFDGGGYTISALNIDGSVTPAGLFSCLQTTAVVKDLKVSGSVIPSGDGQIAGGIAGENYGIILNCTFCGTVSSTQNTGGIAGINAGTGLIQNCTASGAIFGEKMTGGIAGYNMGVIDGCENNAYVNITSTDSSLKLNDINLDSLISITGLSSLDTSTAASDTGGIAGYSAGCIRNCVNQSTIGYQHIGYNVGGIVGRSCGYILNCFNNADIYGRKDVGGIAGQIEPYISMNLTESAIVTLQRQLDELTALIDKTLTDGNAGIGTVISRLNKIADYADSAAAAAGNITTTGSVNTTVNGSGETSSEGSVTVTPPEIEAEGIDGFLSGGTPDLTEGNVSAEGSSSANVSANASTQITVNTSLHGLTSAVNGMTGQLRLLNGEVAGISDTLTADLKAINDQINAISSTVFDIMLGTDDTDTLEDTSETDIDSVTLGKTAQSTNSGMIYGDISVGGIVGSMAIEYELDPEDDVSSDISVNARRRYELKAILQSCVNTGEVISKRSYAGGICGKMDLGYILGSENYGDTESENGNYVGGIAGFTASTIHSSYAKCTLRGGSYIGGIVGSGVTDSSGEASSTVAGCYSLVAITKYTQYIGAVSGVNAGIYSENYFISDTLAGINRLSYTGMAEPVSFSDLLYMPASETREDSEAVTHTVPDAFKQFTLRFVANGKTIKSVAFAYGDSFDETIYPELPETEGCYGSWDITELKDLHFDTTVTAKYTPYVTNLHTADTRSDGRPIFIAEGAYDTLSDLTVTARANTPSDFESLPKGFVDTLWKCFTNKDLSREIVEQWMLELPSDGSDTHTIRYLAPDADPFHLDIYVKTDGNWEKVRTTAIGSYLTFQVEGHQAQIAVISTTPIWWVWLIAGAIVLLLLILLIRLIQKIHAKRAAKKLPAADTETAADASPDGELSFGEE